MMERKEEKKKLLTQFLQGKANPQLSFSYHQSKCLSGGKKKRQGKPLTSDVALVVHIGTLKKALKYCAANHGAGMHPPY